MSMVLMKEPFGIVCEENRIHLYNYETQQTVKSFQVKHAVPRDFSIRLALGQLIHMDRLLKEMEPLEKQIFKKLIEETDSKYFLQTSDITQKHMEEEILKYEAERIGSNYANSLTYNARYKVYKNLKKNVENTGVIVCGAGVLGSRLVEQLLNYSWAGLYLWDDEAVTERDVFHGFFFQKEHIGENRAHVLGKRNPQIKVLEKWEAVDELQGQYDSIHVIYTSENPDSEKIRQLNQYMEEKKIPWSLLWVDSERLIIGPTLYAGQTGCLNCNFELDKLCNKYNLMPYEANLMVGMFISDIGKIIGVMEEAIVEDISVTIGRAFCINRCTMEGKSMDMERQLNCKICGPGKKTVIYVPEAGNNVKEVV